MKKEELEQTSSCEPAVCNNCLTREINPLCSVAAARIEIEESRTMVRFKSGQTIFYQGNEPIGLYVVQEGLVKLEALSPEGSPNTLRLLGPGQALGYRSLFANDKFQASAVVVEDALLCFLPRNVLSSILAKYPEIALNLLHQLAKDLRLAEDKWVIQVNKGAPERVAEALLFLDDHFQDQQWSRKEIAQWAGTTPETVIRNLAQFEKEGLIKLDGRACAILNREKLIDKSQRT